MFDLISIGVTFVDTFIPLIDAKILEDEGERFLALPYGAKISAGPAVTAIGGNAANNAIGSSRLGLKTAVYTHIGKKDESQWDKMIIDKFKKERVDTRYINEVEDLPPGHNIILEFQKERTILNHHQPWKYNLPDLEHCKWIYLTSLAPTFLDSNFLDQVINYIERSGAKLAFQPGGVQIKLGQKKNARILVLTDVFILNLEEAKTFLGIDTGEKVPIKKLLSKLNDLGPKKVVITDGVRGSFGFDGMKFYEMGIFPANVVQVTGCGDAYAAALTAGLFYGKDLGEAMRWGAANGASVCEHAGAQAGLLTYEKLKERLKEI